MNTIRKEIRRFLIRENDNHVRVDEPSVDSDILGTKEIWIIRKDNPTEPFFCYLDPNTIPMFWLEVRIDDLAICKSYPRKGISEYQLLTWEGISEEEKALRIWLGRNNATVSGLSNYSVLKSIWSLNNYRHRAKPKLI